ncbi:mRNA polyadenylation factor [Lithospermum erythrorhizon]|uniref:mRNA polyadenylation factor n=1 Tax=Lithospermum erythrorhizon TaxID=34254 RepID=A0AAV3QEC2_LITER
MTPQILQRRLLCTKTTPLLHPNLLLKQVTKSNFPKSLQDLKTHISQSDLISISLQKTGAFCSSWQRVVPFDTTEIAYLKCKYAAERFQVLQFAVCPFSVKESKIIAYPYVLL